MAQTLPLVVPAYPAINRLHPFADCSFIRRISFCSKGDHCTCRLLVLATASSFIFLQLLLTVFEELLQVEELLLLARRPP